MWTRRNFLQSSSLIALSASLPELFLRSADAAQVGKETVLVVIELTGGNDGLNTVIPFADPEYHKARPTLGFKEYQVITVNDSVGLHPSLRGLKLEELAIVQGVGYPNPDRSHFESMDIWQLADPTRKRKEGWLGRSLVELQDKRNSVLGMHVGPEKLPLAFSGAPAGVVSLANPQTYFFDLNQNESTKPAKRALINELANLGANPEANNESDLLQFVRKRQVQSLQTVDKLQAALGKVPDRRWARGANSLSEQLETVSKLIEQDLGTRLFYVSLSGFDTHSTQAPEHTNLLTQLAAGLQLMFQRLKETNNHQRVLAMTYSEFGRRVAENGSKGTDHGAGSNLFVYGPAVQAGVVGKHPSLTDLDAGDLKWHTDFRKVYATLLEDWLGCNSEKVLGSKFEKLPLLAAKK